MAQRRPVDPAAPPALREFVCELRQVTDAKFESLRALEKAAHVGRSTLSGALSGRRLPTLDVVTAIARACGQDEQTWRERWHATRVELSEGTITGSDAEAPPPEDEPPRDELDRLTSRRFPRVPGRRLAVAVAAAAAAVTATAVLLTDTPGTPHPNGGHSSNAQAPGTTTPSATGAAPAATGATGPPPAATSVSLAGDAGSRVTQPASPPGGVTHAAPGTAGVAALGAPSARVSFEDGTDDWGPFWGGDKLSRTLTTQVAYDGTHSLLLTAGPGSDACAIGTDRVPGLTAGAVVTLHVWFGGQGQGDLRPFVQDTGYHEHFQSPTGLRGSGWTTVSFTVPGVSVKGIGFQIDNTGGGNLVIALDAVDW